MKPSLRRFFDTSFKRQLLVIFTLGFILLTVTSTLILTKISGNAVEKRLIEEGLKLTGTYSAQSTLALLYGSPEVARETSETIMTFPDILGAEILDTNLLPIGSAGEKLKIVKKEHMLSKEAMLIAENEHYWEFFAPAYTGISEKSPSPFEEEVTEKELLGYVHMTMSKQVLQSMQQNILQYNLIVSAVLSALILTILLIITNNVTNPIQRLANVMRRFQNGEKNLRSEASGAKDIIEMSSAFNSMMDVLEAREQALSLARDQALESAKLKGEFATNVSHELRTPMNGVLGMLELLKDMNLSGKQLEYINTAKNSAESLLTLIDDILDFSKNEAGKTSIEVREFNLYNSLENIISLLSSQARQKNIDLAFIIDQNIPYTLLGDGERINQVLLNLVGNAIKFTNNGDVGIFASVQSDHEDKLKIKFEVKDTGIGVAPEAQSRIFEAFLQADGSTTRRHGGTGLGLAICQQLIQLMGGQISLNSETGKGSNFWFELTLLKSSHEAEPPKLINTAVENHRVLVIDDSRLIQKVFADFFRKENIESVSQHDSKNAIRAYKLSLNHNKPYDFVFVDEQLKNESGEELIKKLVYLDQHKNSRFILMSHNFDENEIHQSGLTISANLQKPVRQTELYACLNRLMQPNEAKQQAIIARHSFDHTIHSNLASHNILVIEDNLANQQVAIGMLERLNCQADIASNGKECISKIIDNDYDMILMDCHMPEMDGYEATHHIRELETGDKHLTIIAMTANVQHGDSDKCLDAGMDDYLAKPLKINILKNMLEKWLPGKVIRASQDSSPTHQLMSEVIERNTLSELHTQIGDIMYSMIQSYLKDLPSYVEALEDAIHSSSIKSIADIAHTIRGSSANFGATRLVESCQRLEDLSRAGLTHGAEGLFKEIQTESRLVQEVLSRECEISSKQTNERHTQNESEQQKQTILIVDDDHSSRFAVCEVLKNDGYHIEQASDGREAIIRCEQNTPDLILMDAIMPGMDGFTACRMIKNLPEGRDIPILIVTSLNDESSISRAFSVGATDYISKPVNLSVLKQRVARLVQAHHTQRHVKQLAYRDTLTGLANRRMFNERLDEMIAASSTSKSKLALMFLDLDRFKLINDSLGHDVGDLLLKYFSERINGCMRKGDMVARFGGDEFTIILDNISSNEMVVSVAEKIQKQLSSPFVFMGKEIYLNTSIGITVFPDDGQEINTLLKKADMAMYRAKEKNSHYEFYQTYMEDYVSRRLDLENDLHGAVNRNEFEVYYQPQENLSTGEIYGMEALVRWNHPVKGLIPPLEFIGLAEETGQIIELGEWVLNQACRQLKTWINEGHQPMRVAVNLSATQLEHPNLIHSVKQALEKTRLDPKFLELEITESTIMEKPEQILVTLQQLKDMGILLSIDDFGTGYSSLNYLKRFPIDIIKIDRTFIAELTSSKVDAGIVNTIISLAHILDVKVIAEGVETELQKEFLKQEKCDIIQGYYLSRPIPAASFAQKFLTKRKSVSRKVTHLRPPKKH